MLTVGALTFLTPAALVGAVLLPLVWLLLRLIPPAVRHLDFPAARLLFDLPPTERTSARTPPWLVALRMVLLILALVGLADPVLTADHDENSGPLVIVMDDGWAASAAWDARQKTLRNLLAGAERHNRQAALIKTAPTATPGPAPKLMPAREVLEQIAALAPQPWPADRAAAAAALRELAVTQPAQAVWISDGVATSGDGGLNDVLEHFSNVAIVAPGAAHAPLVLGPPRRNGDDPTHLRLSLHRVGGDDAPDVFAVRAIDKEGRTLARSTVTMAQGTHTGDAILEAPSELSNRIVRFDVESRPGAAATVLADAQLQRRPVGVASSSAGGISAPLLEEAFYIRQALAASADVREGDLNELLSRPLAVLFVANGGRILDTEIDRVTKWVEDGGVLVRFAGPNLTENVDPLLPVRLHAGGRSLSGTLSWSEPAHLAPFPETSPFKFAEIPADVTVSTQVLAEPSADLPAKTWARLDDGTPLITAERRGQGWVVLFHVTAAPDWSNLPLSGLFVDLLRRLVDLSAGVAGETQAGSEALPPLQLLDGYGHLVAPGPTARPLTPATFTAGKIGPSLPPGLYGAPGSATAVNLSPYVANAVPVQAWPAGASLLSFDGVRPESALKPYFLSAALVLLLLDLVISFALRGLAPPVAWRRALSGAVLLLGVFAHDSARGAEPKAAISRDTTAAILETRLAFITTGDATIDHMAASGLSTLTHVLAARTSAEMAEPTAIDLAAADLTADALSPYPLIYWRIGGNQAPPNAKAVAALNAYLHRGGMLVFDAPDHAGTVGGNGAGARLDGILRAINLPPLTAMGDSHVLTRSFYLLKGLPGRFADGAVYVDKGSTSTDGVSSVIVGGNDWAAAWARDTSGLPLFPVVPGGEAQREMAYRAGINMVMYALTGNYKSDQVFLPTIMQRLTQ